MLNAQASQFKLSDEGRILYQPHPTNPLPGEPIARLRKGQTALAPEIEVEDTDLLNGQDTAIIKEFLKTWLKNHIAEILAPLIALQETDALPGPVRGICFQLYEAMGIVPRENLEDLIASLDPAMRQIVRNKQIRLGPILVFLPALNKPAGVRLRGLLWALWNDKSLPAGVPADGIVSLKVENADRNFYQAVGYPIYGPRAIRIDMLDRVISAVYDNAKDGKFKAEHKMAEWLGVPIDDLYAVLTAMGHRKIDAPVPEKKEESIEEKVAEEKPETTEKTPQVKPELASFFLKKGKAFEKSAAAKPKSEKKKGKKPDVKKVNEPRVIQAGIKSRPEDSPFAILGQLKVKKDAS
jgi:ATP-dependent RNA helicase SUPV3L1/SUV3